MNLDAFTIAQVRHYMKEYQNNKFDGTTNIVKELTGKEADDFETIVKSHVNNSPYQKRNFQIGFLLWKIYCIANAICFECKRIRKIQSMKNYNYSKFANKEYNLVHSDGLKVGDKIPDFVLLNLENKTTKISTYFDKPIVLETGSITCGMFAGQSNEMNKIALQNPDFNFLLLYVREAHPGNKISAHISIEENVVWQTD